VISEAARRQVSTRNGMHATFLVDGQVAGVWKLHQGNASATVELDSFRPLNTAEHAEVEAEAARLLEFAAPGAAHHLRNGKAASAGCDETDTGEEANHPYV